MRRDACRSSSTASMGVGKTWYGGREGSFTSPFGTGLTPSQEQKEANLRWAQSLSSSGYPSMTRELLI